MQISRSKISESWMLLNNETELKIIEKKLTNNEEISNE